jgi:hypothetical protein
VSETLRGLETQAVGTSKASGPDFCSLSLRGRDGMRRPVPDGLT